MIGSHNVKELMNIADFREKIKNYSPDDIICTNHTLFRLSEKQR